MSRTLVEILYNVLISAVLLSQIQRLISLMKQFLIIRRLGYMDVGFLDYELLLSTSDHIH